MAQLQMVLLQLLVEVRRLLLRSQRLLLKAVPQQELVLLLLHIMLLRLVQRVSLVMLRRLLTLNRQFLCLVVQPLVLEKFRSLRMLTLQLVIFMLLQPGQMSLGAKKILKMQLVLHQLLFIRAVIPQMATNLRRWYKNPERSVRRVKAQ